MQSRHVERFIDHDLIDRPSVLAIDDDDAADHLLALIIHQRA